MVNGKVSFSVVYTPSERGGAHVSGQVADIIFVLKTGGRRRLFHRRWSVAVG